MGIYFCFAGLAGFAISMVMARDKSKQSKIKAAVVLAVSCVLIIIGLMFPGGKNTGTGAANPSQAEEVSQTEASAPAD